MIIMALDHTRDFMHIDGFYSRPTNLATTTPILFFTRWITHFSAPAFVFLSGTSAYLSGKKKTKQQLSIFLLTRGLWLILIELTLISFAFSFDITFSTISLQVIWAIGMSMIILAVLIFLPMRVILLIGLLILLGHNLFDPVRFKSGTLLNWLWSLLHRPQIFTVKADFTVRLVYPVLPWIGIMALGYCFGELYTRKFEPQKRKRWLLLLGIGSILLFALLRTTNWYGDPRRWGLQKDWLFTLMSFINTTKYPPSLLFTLMTLGPAILLLYFIEGWKSRISDILLVYGRVPLFYYILHFYIIHTLSIISLLLAGLTWNEMDFKHVRGGIPQGYGLPLGLVYVIWIMIVAVLYPLCRWYGQFKSKATSKIWSYL